jgi:hypothetical protein
MKPGRSRWAVLRESSGRRISEITRSVLDRKFVGLALGLVLMGCAVVTGLVALIAWRSSISLDQRLAALGATFTGGAFSLAVVGSIVALLAYFIAIQRPTLIAHITIADIEGQTIRVGLGRPDQFGERHIFQLPGYRRPADNLPLRITVENTSDWSARNVAVRVDFKSIRRIAHPGGWDIADYHAAITNEIIALQWEGGADYAIHGHWPRTLPTIYLTDALIEAPADECAMVVDVVAEGFRHSWSYAIESEPQVDMPDRQHGAIVGYSGYPSSGVPALRVYAYPLGGGSPAISQIVVGYGYRWFWIDGLDPGDYHIVAYRADNPDQKGAYTVGARDGDYTASADHTLIPVVVTAGNVTTGVRITDWLHDKFPAEPRT